MNMTFLLFSLSAYPLRFRMLRVISSLVRRESVKGSHLRALSDLLPNHAEGSAESRRILKLQLKDQLSAVLRAAAVTRKSYSVGDFRAPTN